MANKFLIWIESSSNVITQEQFSTIADRISGFKSGTRAVAAHVNAGLRQANLVVAALMNVISPNSQLDLTSSLDDVISEISSHLQVDLNIRNGTESGSIRSINSIANSGNTAAFGASRASGSHSFAANNSVAQGQFSAVFGRLCSDASLSLLCNFIAGNENSNVNANYASVTGRKNKVGGSSSSETPGLELCPFVHGDNNRVYGSKKYVVVIGAENVVTHNNVVALGQGHVSSADNQILLGSYSVQNSNALLSLGAGTSDSNRQTIFEILSTGDVVLKEDSCISNGSWSENYPLYYPLVKFDNKFAVDNRGIHVSGAHRIKGSESVSAVWKDELWLSSLYVHDSANNITFNITMTHMGQTEPTLNSFIHDIGNFGGTVVASGAFVSTDTSPGSFVVNRVFANSETNDITLLGVNVVNNQLSFKNIVMTWSRLNQTSGIQVVFSTKLYTNI